MKSKKIITLTMLSSIVGTTFFNSIPVFADELSDSNKHVVGIESNENDLNQIINIPDMNLKAYINAALHHEATAPITQKDADSITKLEIDDNVFMPVRNLQGISQLHNLKEFYFYDQSNESDKVKNLSEIGKLNNLETLIFSSLSDNLDFLKENKSIKCLMLYMPNLENLSALTGTSIKELTLFQCYKLTDISALTQIKSLGWVRINDLPFSDSNYDIIKTLILHDVGITLPSNWASQILKSEINSAQLQIMSPTHYYTQDSLDKLILAIEECKSLLNDSSFTSEQLNKSIKDIQEARNGLISINKPSIPGQKPRF